jgi:uncharacterized membrane-anchored protein YitT (DUF2179 family)
MAKTKIRSYLLDTVFIISGSALFALGLVIFLEPNNIAPGGVSGIAMIINYLFPSVPIGVLIIALNIPLFLVGWKFEGKPFLIKSLFGTFLSSVMIDLFSNVYRYTSDSLLAGIYGGIMIGVGLGLLFSRGATTGGSDIVGRLLKIKFPHLSMGRLVLGVDIIVVSAAAIIFGHFNYALYALISLYICSIALDKILYGFDTAKVAYIITQYPEEVFRRIDTELERGVTYLDGQGAYSGKPTKVILTAIKMRQIGQLKQIVREVDPSSFVIISDAHEVLGDGFRAHHDRQL